MQACCVPYFSVAVINCHVQGNLWNQVYLGSWFQRAGVYAGGRYCSQWLVEAQCGVPPEPGQEEAGMFQAEEDVREVQQHRGKTEAGGAKREVEREERVTPARLGRPLGPDFPMSS